MKRRQHGGGSRNRSSGSGNSKKTKKVGGVFGDQDRQEDDDDAWEEILAENHPNANSGSAKKRIAVFVAVVSLLVLAAAIYLASSSSLSSSSSSLDDNNRSQQEREAKAAAGGTGDAAANDTNTANRRSAADYAVFGARLINSGDAEGAVAELLEGRRLYPSELRILLNLGIAQYRMGRYEESLEAYEEVVKLTEGRKDLSTGDLKSRSQAMHGIATAYKQIHRPMTADERNSEEHRGHLRTAVHWMEKSIRTYPSHVAHTVLEEMYLELPDYAKAAEQVHKSVTTTPRSEVGVNADVDYRNGWLAFMHLGCSRLAYSALRHCLDVACTLSHSRFPKSRIHSQAAAALMKLGGDRDGFGGSGGDGNNRTAEVERQIDVHVRKATELLKHDGPARTIKYVRGTVLKPFEGVPDGTGGATCGELETKFRPVFGIAFSGSPEGGGDSGDVVEETTAPSSSSSLWSVAYVRHVLTFQYPVDSDLLDRIRDEMEGKKRAFEVHGFASPELDDSHHFIKPFQCLGFLYYTLEDCVFVSRVAALQRRAKLQSELAAAAAAAAKSKSPSDLVLMTPDDFDRGQFPDLSSRGGTPPSAFLHVGLFSADLRVHPMTPLVKAFLVHAKREAKERLGLNLKITLYHTQSDAGVLASLRRHVDEDYEVTSPNDWKEAVRHAREPERRVHVWLETSGSTGKGIMALAAAGPAPVGALWAGFPGSMAEAPEALQYMVTDRYTVPPPEDEGGSEEESAAVANIYPEKMIYVPGSWLIASPPLDDLPSPLLLRDEDEGKFQRRREELRKQHNIPVDAVVYSNFGRLWKLDDTTFNSWCEIAKRVPNSYFVLLRMEADAVSSGTVGNIQKAWTEQHGLPVNRLVFVPPHRSGEHIQVMGHLSDVALDTSSYGGGATSYDALRAGLPQVHRPGGFKMMQRAGGSIVNAAGLGDQLVCRTVEQYIDVAVRLGVDLPYRQEIKNRLKDALIGKGDAVLFRPEVGVAALVRGLRDAYQLWYAGKPPATIFVDDIPQEAPDQEKEEEEAKLREEEENDEL